MQTPDFTATPQFDRAFEAEYGQAVIVAPNVHRLTARNPSPFTFLGTNSYVVGTTNLAVIDPGPQDEEHLAALLGFIAGRTVSHIFITHTHVDHSPLSRALAEKTGALIVGAASHHSARALGVGEINLLDASADHAHNPDKVLDDGEMIESDEWALKAISTPGHTANHLAFELVGDGILFSGDHVMAWATSIIAPPDGSMAAYMASLDKLLAMEHGIFLPGHGGPANKPQQLLRGLKAHRKMRERAIIERLSKGDREIKTIVSHIYSDTDPRLHGAAALSVFAHMEYLVSSGKVKCADTLHLEAEYFLSRD